MSDNATSPEIHESSNILGLTAQIVSAHVVKNRVDADALPSLIQSVYRSLSTAGEPPAVPPVQTPAVPIKKSVFPDYLVCLEDGKQLRIMKRYLEVRYGMTPDEYRMKWNLPSDYPMVAPNYASRRSELARNSGLGRKTAEQAVSEPVIKNLPAKRARGAKR